MAQILTPSVAYWGEPDQVIWVDLGHRRLQGADNYWLAGNRYGMWQDPENIGTMYSTPANPSGWEMVDGVERELDDPTPPADAQVWRGFMLTTEQAEFVGIL